LDVESDEIGLRTVAVRPGSASLDTPVLSSLPDQLHRGESEEPESMDEVASAEL